MVRKIKTAAAGEDVPAICRELQELQRIRAVLIKSRIMARNRLQAVVAGTLGYSSNMTEKDRLAKFAEADALIERVVKEKVPCKFDHVIIPTMLGVKAFEREQAAVEKQMVGLAARLPVADWVALPEQRGFGLQMFAVVVGECGNLANYPNPAKVWKRLGCAPWTFNGTTLMPATWRGGKHGKLPAAEWEACGYSPRRRSIAYLIGDLIVKGNTPRQPRTGDEALETDQISARPGCRKAGEGGDRSSETETALAPLPGPYRALYDATKLSWAAKHPDYPKQRVHRHAMLVATKRLLLNLWLFWNDVPWREWTHGDVEQGGARGDSGNEADWRSAPAPPAAEPKRRKVAAAAKVRE